MPTYIYGDDESRYYPYPPFVRTFSPGDEIDLDADQVPRDGRFWLKGPDGERLPLPPAGEPSPAEATTDPVSDEPDDTQDTRPAAANPAPGAAKTTKTTAQKSKEA